MKTSVNAVSIKCKYQQFPWKLHEMLDLADEEGFAHIVSWSPDGRSFRVHDKDGFAETLMSDYFKSDRYKTFQRNLNLWGFRTFKRGQNKGAIYHEHFVRGQRDLCDQMVRIRVKQKNARKAVQEQQKLTDGSIHVGVGHGHNHLTAAAIRTLGAPDATNGNVTGVPGWNHLSQQKQNSGSVANAPLQSLGASLGNNGATRNAPSSPSASAAPAGKSDAPTVASGSSSTPFPQTHQSYQTLLASLLSPTPAAATSSPPLVNANGTPPPRGSIAAQAADTYALATLAANLSKTAITGSQPEDVFNKLNLILLLNRIQSLTSQLHQQAASVDAICNASQAPAAQPPASATRSISLAASPPVPSMDILQSLLSVTSNKPSPQTPASPPTAAATATPSSLSTMSNEQILALLSVLSRQNASALNHRDSSNSDNDSSNSTAANDQSRPDQSYSVNGPVAPASVRAPSGQATMPSNTPAAFSAPSRSCKTSDIQKILETLQSIGSSRQLQPSSDRNQGPQRSSRTTPTSSTSSSSSSSSPTPSHSTQQQTVATTAATSHSTVGSAPFSAPLLNPQLFTRGTPVADQQRQ